MTLEFVNLVQVSCRRQSDSAFAQRGLASLTLFFSVNFCQKWGVLCSSDKKFPEFFEIHHTFVWGVDKNFTIGCLKVRPETLPPKILSEKPPWNNKFSKSALNGKKRILRRRYFFCDKWVSGIPPPRLWHLSQKKGFLFLKASLIDPRSRSMFYVHYE